MAYGDYSGPDKPNKGFEDGACNRQRCQAEPARFYNHGSLRWYCNDCARDIGNDTVNARTWPQDFGRMFPGEPLHPMFETREQIDARKLGRPLNPTDNATQDQIDIANRAVEVNLNPDGTTKYGTAQGYACALSALHIASEREDFLTQLRRVNTERYNAWVGDGQDAGILFDAAELGGEVGELLNVVKKLVREEAGWRGSRAAPEDFGDECGDVLICLDKLARRRGVDLAEVTARKFNAMSDKVGLPHKLETLSARGAGHPLGSKARIIAAMDKVAAS